MSRSTGHAAPQQELGEPLRDGMYAILVRARRMKMRHWTEDYTGPTHEFVLCVAVPVAVGLRLVSCV